MPNPCPARLPRAAGDERTAGRRNRLLPAMPRRLARSRRARQDHRARRPGLCCGGSPDRPRISRRRAATTMTPVTAATMAAIPQAPQVLPRGIVRLGRGGCGRGPVSRRRPRRAAPPARRGTPLPPGRCAAAPRPDRRRPKRSRRAGAGPFPRARTARRGSRGRRRRDRAQPGKACLEFRRRSGEAPGPTSRRPATVRLQANRRSKLRSPSRARNVQLVQPLVWPGVRWATSSSAPIRRRSPSSTWRSTATGAKCAVSSRSALKPRARSAASAVLATTPAPDKRCSSASPPAWSQWAWLISRWRTSPMRKPSLATLAAIWGALFHAAVDQHVARRIGDEIGADMGGADIIDVTDDPERLDQPVPARALFGEVDCAAAGAANAINRAATPARRSFPSPPLKHVTKHVAEPDGVGNQAFLELDARWNPRIGSGSGCRIVIAENRFPLFRTMLGPGSARDGGRPGRRRWRRVADRRA